MVSVYFTSVLHTFVHIQQVLINNQKTKSADCHKLPRTTQINPQVKPALPFVTKGGELSATTWFLNGVGGLARIYTTLKEVKDPFVLVSFVCSTLLNFTILLQIIFYKSKATTE